MSYLWIPESLNLRQALVLGAIIRHYSRPCLGWRALCVLEESRVPVSLPR